MRTFIVVLLTIYIVFSILRLFGLFEINTRPSKVVTVIKDERKRRKQKKSETKLLGLYTSTVNLFKGILMSDTCRENHKFYIDRLELKTKTLGRKLTPEELRGKYAFPLFCSFLLIPVVFFYPILVVVPVSCLLRFLTYQTIYRQKIYDEDEIIDDYFIDLYLLVFSKLRQGSRARLQGTIENYINTIESQSLTLENEVMLKFSRYFLNLLALYEDHQAVPRLRETYRSATVINFCNIASQALQGIDNFDNLITFKMQLVERKTNLMRKKQQAILRKGERSIYAIWIILFIFIAVGWYSKLPTGFF